MKNTNPLEKVIEKKVCDHAKGLGCLVYKFTSPSRRSVPDRLFIMPNGKGVFFIEFKRKGCKPTPAQEIEIDKIRKMGIRVRVVNSVFEGMQVVNESLTVFCNEHKNKIACAVIELQKAVNEITPLTMDDPAFN